MGPHDDHRPEDFSDVERRLREQREQPTGLELDAMKMRIAKGASPARTGLRLRTRLATGLLTVGLMASMSTAGVVAAHSSKGGNPPNHSQGKGKHNPPPPPKPKPKPKPPKGGGHGQYCPPPRHGHDSDCSQGDGHSDSSSDSSSSSSSDKSSDKKGGKKH